MTQRIIKGAFWHGGYFKKSKKTILDFHSPRSPGSPSISECHKIHGFIRAKHIKRPRILILGATPRFRDLSHELNAEVTCADLSLDMLLKMVNFMKKPKNLEKEILVRADWLKMPLQENYWDYVLGDFVLHQMPIKFWNQFLLKIKSILRSRGYFITRQLSAKQYPPALDIFEKFAPIKISIDSLHAIGHELLCSAWNPKSMTTSSDKLHQKLNQIMRKPPNKKIKALIKNTKSLVTPGKTWWHATKEENEKFFKQYFRISAIKYGFDHPYVNECPIYFLKK